MMMMMMSTAKNEPDRAGSDIELTPESSRASVKTSLHFDRHLFICLQSWKSTLADDGTVFY